MYEDKFPNIDPYDFVVTIFLLRKQLLTIKINKNFKNFFFCQKFYGFYSVQLFYVVYVYTHIQSFVHRKIHEPNQTVAIL